MTTTRRKLDRESTESMQMLGDATVIIGQAVDLLCRLQPPRAELSDELDDQRLSILRQITEFVTEWQSAIPELPKLMRGVVAGCQAARSRGLQ
jgi:hypothetical protein